jgi:hypothetical protein
VVTRALALAAGARLDVSDNPLIVDYAADGSSPLASLRGSIASAYQPGAGAHWNGAGVTSSRIASLTAHALGYGEAADVLRLAGGQTGTFGSETVDATAVLVRVTPIGDADLDGRVTFIDFQRLERGFGQVGAVWSEGDFDYDGQTKFEDFRALYDNFGATQVAGRAGEARMVRGAPAAGVELLKAAQVARPRAKPARRA